MTDELFPEPPRAIKSRRLVYRVIVIDDTRPAEVDEDYQAALRYPSGWPYCHRFTRSAANVQVSKLGEQGIVATVQRGRITWEVEQRG